MIDITPYLGYEERYSNEELSSIIEQGTIYMCACPAQVADTLRNLRALLQYQMRCTSDPENNSLVHDAIAKSTIQAHMTMQNCLDAVIAMEKWDRTTLKMPEGLRKRQMQIVLSDDSQT